EIIHPEPEFLEIDLGQVLAIDRVGIKVVFLQVSAKAMTLLIFSPEKSGNEQNDGRNDRRDDVYRDVAALDHLRWSKLYNLPVRFNRSIFSTATSAGRESAYATASPISSGNIIFS